MKLAPTAAALIGPAVREAVGGLRRARLLPAQVRISVAVGDGTAARAAADELASIAETFGTGALRAAAAWARDRQCRILKIETQNTNVAACRRKERDRRRVSIQVDARQVADDATGAV